MYILSRMTTHLSRILLVYLLPQMMLSLHTVSSVGARWVPFVFIAPPVFAYKNVLLDVKGCVNVPIIKPSIRRWLTRERARFSCRSRLMWPVLYAYLTAILSVSLSPHPCDSCKRDCQLAMQMKCKVTAPGEAMGKMHANEFFIVVFLNKLHILVLVALNRQPD